MNIVPDMPPGMELAPGNSRIDGVFLAFGGKTAWLEAPTGKAAWDLEDSGGRWVVTEADFQLALDTDAQPRWFR